MDFFSSVFDNQSVVSEDGTQFDFMKGDTSNQNDPTPSFLNPLPPSECQSQSQSSFLNNLFVNQQPSKVKKKENSSNFMEQIKSVQNLFSSKELSSIFNGNNNVIMEKCNEEDNEGQVNRNFIPSSKRKLSDGKEPEISLKESTFNQPESKTVNENKKNYIPSQLSHFLEEVKEEKPKVQNNPKKNQEKIENSIDMINNYGVLNSILKEKKEKMKIVDNLMKNFEVLYQVTEDFKFNFKNLFKKYLEGYFENLNEMNAILLVDDIEIDDLIENCEEKIEKLSLKLNSFV